jgi:hypothetical protein
MAKEEGSSSKPAWIGGIATVLAAIVGGLFALHHVDKTPISFSAEVRSSAGQMISGARALVAADQSTPQVVFSDENGIFHVDLSDSPKSLRITLSALGYIPVSRDVNPHRTGPEEFVLEPETKSAPPHLQSPSHGTTVTHGNNSPVVIGNHNTIGDSKK